MEQKIHYRVRKISQVEPVLSQLSPIYTFTLPCHNSLFVSLPLYARVSEMVHFLFSYPSILFLIHFAFPWALHDLPISTVL